MSKARTIADRAFASQAEAEAGTDVSKLMNALATKQAIQVSALPAPTKQIFTSSGIWSKPPGCRLVKITATGGGRGAGDNGAIVLPGHAADTVIKYLDVSAINSATITIGAGGAGTSGNQSSGGNTTWSDGTNTVRAAGGNNTSTISGGNSGSTGGDITIPGGYPDGNGGNFAQSGGASFWGGSSRSTAPAFGSGGYAAAALAGLGGSGANGVILVEEFY